MTRKFFALCLLALACGAQDQVAGEDLDGSGLDLLTGDPVYVEANQEGDIGQVEQAFIAPQSPGFQVGTNTANARLRCDKTSTGQVCVIPPKKTLSTCVYMPFAILPPDPLTFTDAEYNAIVATITSLDGISGWTFNQAPKFTDCFAKAFDIIVLNTAVGSSGTASNDVKDYGIPVWTTVGGVQGGFTSLTEGAGVAGQYQTWTVCQARVDGVDIYAKGTSATQDTNGMNHAITHSLLGCLGVGGHSGDGGRASRLLFNPATTATTITAGEVCALGGFTTASAGQFNIAPIGCPSD